MGAATKQNRTRETWLEVAVAPARKVLFTTSALKLVAKLFELVALVRSRPHFYVSEERAFRNEISRQRGDALVRMPRQ